MSESKHWRQGITKKSNTDKKITIRFGHSPDPDDAFMFYALAYKKIDTGIYEFKDVVEDIESLNRRALKAELEATAISVHTLAYVADRYAVMPCGASVGEGYGPILVSKRRISSNQISRYKIAIPGELTTAFLVLRLFEANISTYTVMPFDKIIPAVLDGEVDIGLIIHEGQITYRDKGLRLVVDLGKWWYEETKLPLPLGVDVVHKDLGTAVMTDVTEIFRQSIRYGVQNRQGALDYALRFSRGLPSRKADRFIKMYVNQRTLEWSERCAEALDLLFLKALRAGIFSGAPKIDYVVNSILV